MDIYLFSFSKRSRSTARPAQSSGTLYQCTLREPSGIVNPFIRIQMQPTAHPEYNYAYIPEFHRYYWIAEWIYTMGSVWEASLNVDSLASWKTEIGNKSMYVLRSAARSDGRIVDSYYPTLAEPRSYIDRVSAVTISNKAGNSYSLSNFWTGAAGYYYLGIVGNNRTGVSCYCLTYNAFKILLQELTNFQPSDMSDVSSGIAKQMANPMQYIVYCYWLPFAPAGKTFTTNATINFGYYSITISGTLAAIVEVDPLDDCVKCEFSFNLRKHPQAEERGAYLNQAPFSDYRVQILPFGVFQLDGSMMITDQTIRCEFWTDFSTGLAQLSVWATNTLLAKQKAQLGVPVNMSQAVVDYIGAAAGAGSAVFGSLGSAVVGDFGGFFQNLGAGITNAANAMQPKVAQLGGGGDYLAWINDPPALLSDFYLIADEYNTDLGRPLCQVTTPEALGSGYIQAMDGDLQAPATQRELDEIAGYLTGGFFYE